jgi:hypothetical protein
MDASGLAKKPEGFAVAENVSECENMVRVKKRKAGNEVRSKQ